MPAHPFHCRRCGNCCTLVPGAYGNSVETEDIQRWESQGREDILAWVLPWYAGSGTVLYELWVDPQTGEMADACPWLEERADGTTICRIHDTKPRHCRDWPPGRAEAHRANCRAYEGMAEAPG